ncbi:MAG TPA: hypothetical protein VLE73_02755 [Candidatus Saccharimonadales bacterium]|nr:hypothetical protein [Candidatus Saccharimonadales bacterium]
MPLVSIRRPVINAEQAMLREHIPAVDRLGHLGIKWRKMGEMGVTLLERGQYQRAAEKSQARLGALAAQDVATELNQSVLPKMPYGNYRFTAEVSNIDFMGQGRYLGIAYILDAPELVEQRDFITLDLDRRNGITAYWGDFEPHATVATIDHAYAKESVLEDFWEFAPETITLLAARAEAS